MSILETAKDVITLVQKADNLELVKQVLALQSDIMKMMDENRALKDENLALREQLRVKQKLVFRNNAYWLPNEDGSEEGPFCATCRDGDNKMVRMSQSPATGYPSGQPRLIFGSDPAGRGEVIHVGEIPPGHAREDGEEIIFHRHAEPSAGFHDREYGGDFGAGLSAAYVQPVFSSQCDWAHGVFGEIVG